MPVKAYYVNRDGKFARDLSRKEIVRAYESGEGLLWVDVEGTTEEDGLFLEQELHFHHLVVEDCISPLIHPPKIDPFKDYIFLIVHGINHAKEEVVETSELAVFLGANFVVTNHNNPMYSVSAVEQMVDDDGRFMQRGPDFLAHAIIDALVDNVMPTVDRMTDFAEEIEEEVIRQPHANVLDGVLRLKRSSLKVHRIMAPQREVLNRLSRGEFPLIKPDAQIFYRDIYDHIIRIEDLNQTVLDRADNALSTYLSSVANRQNETMRILSIVATIFLPLTLLAGIYGMNFDYMPELHWKWGYYTVLGVILVVVLVLVWRFWASGWFAWGRRRMARARTFRVDKAKIRGYLSPNQKRRAGAAKTAKS